jgi:low temperature requirement protein LtrA
MEPADDHVVRIHIPMRARRVDEPHRVSSGLELLFDLTFVVAIATATAQYAHAVEDGHALDGLAPFLAVFFSIWWAWMNFTWFASSYDTDDVPYRLLTLLQMAGVLVLAAGVPAATEGDFRAVTAGYLIMRVGLVALWWRAARSDPAGRVTAVRNAVGLTVLQVGWLGRLALEGPAQPLSFVVLVVLELALPLWADGRRGTSWHPHHIAERYSLFTIILLGESVLAVSTGVADALEAGLTGPLVVTAPAGLALLFGLWWLYSLQPSGEGLSTRRDRAYLWGYGHYGIFAALAALGAGLEVAVARAGHGDGSPVAAGFAVAVPVAVFLVLLWAVHAPIVTRSRPAPPVLLAGAAGCLVLPLAAGVVGVAGVLVALAAVGALLIVLVALRQRHA